MQKVYGLLLSLIALIVMIFNRSAVEEAYSYKFAYRFFRPPIPVARAIVIFSALVLFALGILLGFDLMN